MRMGFRAEFNGGVCGKCNGRIAKDDKIQFNAANEVEHSDCVPELEHSDLDGTPVRWNTAESLDRAELLDMELQRVAPLGPQGKCPACFIELPRNGICDEHGRPA
jgi:hypothetical protein